MQKVAFLFLILITGFCLEPLPVLAQDQYPNKGDSKDAEGSPHKGKGPPRGARDIAKGTKQQAVSQRDQSSGKNGNGPTEKALRSKFISTQEGGGNSRSYQQAGQSGSSRQQTPAFAVQGNMANHYNGRWSSADAHTDWDQRTNHRWHDRDYRWYDGGWLIIDPGYSPGYNLSGSVGSDVQASLAQQGYYHGPIDGYIGRGTRHAIAHYESDNGLQVNGLIDQPLLVSLRLE